MTYCKYKDEDLIALMKTGTLRLYSEREKATLYHKARVIDYATDGLNTYLLHEEIKNILEAMA